MDATSTTAIGRILRRHWWLLFVGVVLGLGSGGLALAVSRPVYAASASVLVLPIGEAEVNLQTEAQLARSTQTAMEAATLLAQALATAAPDDVDPRQAADVEVLPNTSVLLIHYEAPTPQAAQVGARAFAEAYLANRATAAQASIDDQRSALTGRITQFDAQVAALNARIGRLSPSAAELAGLRGAVAALAAQITSLTTKTNELATTTVHAGRIIKEPDLPTEPVRPNGWFYLASAGAAGSIIGLLTAIARERLSRRVSDGADVTRRDGIPLLAELATERVGGRAVVLSSKEPGGRAFNRLRNEVVASLAATDQVILVTGASPGGASTVVAANLAAALARADNQVILVGANVAEFGTDAVTLSHIFDVADIPGLTDVLTGRASLPRALQRAARAPRLNIVTPGGTASAAGLLQSEGVRGALQALRRQARYVVVEAPSAACGADAQSLAGVADAAILVVEAGRARHAQVTDAAIQLRLVGTRLLGAIVLPRYVPQPEDPEPFRPMHRAEDARELFTANQPSWAANQPTRAANQPSWAANQPSWAQDPPLAALDEPTALLELLRQPGEVDTQQPQTQIQN